MENRRRIGVGHRKLRPRDQSRVLGRGQRRTLDGRPAPGRQPLHRIDHRHRCRHRQNRMIYIPVNENLCATIAATTIEYKAGSLYTGATTALSVAPGADHVGEVQAWNVDTGKKVWTHTYTNTPNWGPMLATAGGLV